MDAFFEAEYPQITSGNSGSNYPSFNCYFNRDIVKKANLRWSSLKMNAKSAENSISFDCREEIHRRQLVEFDINPLNKFMNTNFARSSSRSQIWIRIFSTEGPGPIMIRRFIIAELRAVPDFFASMSDRDIRVSGTLDQCFDKIRERFNAKIVGIDGDKISNQHFNWDLIVFVSFVTRKGEIDSLTSRSLRKELKQFLHNGNEIYTIGAVTWNSLSATQNKWSLVNSIWYSD